MNGGNNKNKTNKQSLQYFLALPLLCVQLDLSVAFPTRFLLEPFFCYHVQGTFSDAIITVNKKHHALNQLTRKFVFSKRLFNYNKYSLIEHLQESYGIKMTKKSPHKL